MAEINTKLLTEMRTSGLVRDGHFAFRSGQHSAVALDRDRLLSDPSFASHLGYVIAKEFFSAHVDTVAAPSMWGAALAQWVAYFLQPKATIVFARPDNGGFVIPPTLIDAIDGRRVLLIDNLIISGETMSRFDDVIRLHGAEIVGAGSLWTTADLTVGGQPAFGLFNTQYPVYAALECPLCASGVPSETSPY
jgi:orotate phosphoribosyltransferase